MPHARFSCITSIPLIVAASLALLLPSSAAATPLCVAGTLQDYQALSAGCSVGPLLFSNFAYASVDLGGNPTLVPASEVSVVPLDDSNLPGLSFRANWGVAFAASDHLIFYDVSTLSGLPTIVSAHLDWDHFRRGLAVASLDEILCLGGSWSNLCADGERVQFFLRDSPTTPNQSVNEIHFAPTNHVGAIKDVFVFGLAGSASITRADNRWDLMQGDDVPEPASLTLAGLGAAFCLIRARRRSTALKAR